MTRKEALELILASLEDHYCGVICGMTTTMLHLRCASSENNITGNLQIMGKSIDAAIQ